MRFINSRFPAFLVLCWLALPVWASYEIYEGTVIKVSDGDTIRILARGQNLKIRLSGIDAPEKDQPYGKRARKALADMVAGKNVSVLTRISHPYRRKRPFILV